MPKKYRKKPVVVEALKTYQGQPMKELQEFVKGKIQIYGCGVVFNDKIEGTLEVSPGDYIIKHECGRITACSAAEFDATYDEVKSNLSNLTVKVNFESLVTDVDKVIAEVNKHLYEAAGVAFPAIKKDEELTEMVKEMNKTGALTLVESEPLLKVGVGFADSPNEQLKTVLHVIADRVASECQDLDKLNDEGRLRELSYLIDAYGSLYSKLF